MIPFEKIEDRLKALGKNRAWLAEESGRKPDSVRVALAPNAHPSKRSELLQKALSDAIEREEAARDNQGIPPSVGVFTILDTPERVDLAYRAAAKIGVESITDFCREAIERRADEIIAGTGDPCGLPYVPHASSGDLTAEFPERETPTPLAALPPAPSADVPKKA